MRYFLVRCSIYNVFHTNIFEWFQFESCSLHGSKSFGRTGDRHTGGIHRQAIFYELPIASLSSQFSCSSLLQLLHSSGYSPRAKSCVLAVRIRSICRRGSHHIYFIVFQQNHSRYQLTENIRMLKVLIPIIWYLQKKVSLEIICRAHTSLGMFGSGFFLLLKIVFPSTDLYPLIEVHTNLRAYIYTSLHTNYYRNLLICYTCKELSCRLF